MTSATLRLRTRNNRTISCMPSRMRWPSMKAAGRAENESLSRTMSATLRVTGLPERIATPTSAALSAGTSLTPSPIIAT